MGLANIDNQGIAGIEKRPDGQGLGRPPHSGGFTVNRMEKPVELCGRPARPARTARRADRRASRYRRSPRRDLVNDVHSGEILPMVSVPDLDPNNPKEANDPTRINRPDHRRLRDGLDPQGAHARHGVDPGQGRHCRLDL